MSNMAYITQKSDNGLFRFLGMDILSVQKEEPFSDIVARLRKKDISLAFVSEYIYMKYAQEIDAMDMHKDISFTVLADGAEFKEIGKKRMETMVETTIGVKLQGGM